MNRHTTSTLSKSPKIDSAQAAKCRSLGPKLARKRYAAVTWLPSYFDEIWPLTGRGSAWDHSSAIAVRVVFVAGVLRSTSADDLLSVLKLPRKYVKDLVAHLDDLRWAEKLLPKLAPAVKYQLTFDGFEDILDAVKVKRNHSFLDVLDSFSFARQKPASPVAINPAV